MCDGEGRGGDAMMGLGGEAATWETVAGVAEGGKEVDGWQKGLLRLKFLLCSLSNQTFVLPFVYLDDK